MFKSSRKVKNIFFFIFGNLRNEIFMSNVGGEKAYFTMRFSTEMFITGKTSLSASGQ